MNYLKLAGAPKAEPVFFKGQPPKAYLENPSNWAVWAPDGLDPRFRCIGENLRAYGARAAELMQFGLMWLGESAEREAA